MRYADEGIDEAAVRRLVRAQNVEVVAGLDELDNEQRAALAAWLDDGLDGPSIADKVAADEAPAVDGVVHRAKKYGQAWEHALRVVEHAGADPSVVWRNPAPRGELVDDAAWRQATVDAYATGRGAVEVSRSPDGEPAVRYYLDQPIRPREP